MSRPSPGSPGSLGTAVPVLRVLQFDTAQDFYVGYLDFRADWVDRPADAPVYARLRRDDAVLDLSEHHDDGTFGTVVWVAVRDVAAFHDDLRSRDYRGLRPGIETGSPAGPYVAVTDPFGNTVRFHQPDDRGGIEDAEV